MLRWALIFLVVVLLAGVFGFRRLGRYGDVHRPHSVHPVPGAVHHLADHRPSTAARLTPG